MGKDPFDILMPVHRAQPNGETDRARALFTKFLNNGFSYNEISNHPDWLAYASAETLTVILPLMIDEMLRRKDTINFLVYPMLSAVDPESGNHSAAFAQRTVKLISLADGPLIDTICKFLAALKPEPPVPDDRFDRLVAFWQNRQRSTRAS